MSIKRTSAALASMASALSLAGMAHATVYDLTLDHCSVACGPQASFGTITTSDDADGVGMDVSVVLHNGNSFTNTGLNAFVFNLSGTPTITIANVVSSPSADTFSLNLPAPTPGGNHQDGFGNWPYALELNGQQGGGGGPTNLSFEIKGAGTDLASFIPVFDSVDNKNVYFSADIYSGTTGATGPVGATLTAVPEPATWALMLFGLGAIGAGMRASRRSSTALAAA